MPKAPQHRLKVTFPNEAPICYRNAYETVLAVLNRIGSERFPEITLEIRKGCRVVTQKVAREDEKYKKEICPGWWYINKGMDTEAKMRQLVLIRQLFGLDFKVEMGSDFEVTHTVKKKKNAKKPKGKLIVSFSDGSSTEDDFVNYLDVYLECIYRLTPEAVAKKNFLYGQDLLPIITNTNFGNNRVQVGEHYWIIKPKNTKEAYKILMRIKGEEYADMIEKIEIV